MVSRVGSIAALLAVCAVAVVSASARQPPTGTAMYLVQQDSRLCPSPRCGGYWVTIVNGVRTRCQDGLRHVRCYVARAIDRNGLRLGRIVDGALVRGALGAGRDDLGELLVAAVYAPSGAAPPSGGYYGVVDTGVRCVRAPCFSYRATQVNGATRTRMSAVDPAASGAPAAEVARANRALRTKNGLYARGRFARSDDGGTVFRALRLYLRAPLPRV